MLGIHYFKADSSTYVIQTAGGKIKRQGKGLTFFYLAAKTSIAAIPVNVQEAPFIFNVQTADYQDVSVQGQIAFRIEAPTLIAEVMNFNLQPDGLTYRSEDPQKVSDRVVRAAQSVIQTQIEQANLRVALHLSQSLSTILRDTLGSPGGTGALNTLGIALVDVAIATIRPKPETARALEAEAREAILKEADDAIYLRRKSAVEQERTIKEAELQTELSVQQKEQEIEECRIANERAVILGEADTAKERLQREIEQEGQRSEFVKRHAENRQREADTEAYQISARVKAFNDLPVENLKAMALAKMNPEQLFAVALDTLAQNAGKIGELNFGQDMLTNLIRKGNVQ